MEDWVWKDIEFQVQTPSEETSTLRKQAKMAEYQGVPFRLMYWCLQYEMMVSHFAWRNPWFFTLLAGS